MSSFMSILVIHGYHRSYQNVACHLAVIVTITPSRSQIYATHFKIGHHAVGEIYVSPTFKLVAISCLNKIHLYRTTH